MTKLSDITSKLKMTKFRVQMTEQAAIDVQKAMFVMGFRDFFSNSGTPRVARTRTRFANLPIHAFYIDADCRIHMTGKPGSFSDTSNAAYREIPILEVFEASRQFKALEKELRKQRKLEKKLAKDGWRVNQGTEVGESLVSEVLFRDGSTRRGSAGDWRIPFEYNHEKTVVGYKLYSDEVKPVATISLAEMVAGIVADAGGVEVDDDGYTVWTGEGFRSSSKNMSGPVPAGTRIDVKYRDGEIQTNVGAGTIPAEGNRYPAGAFWSNDGECNDIVAYRLTKQEPVADTDGWITRDPSTSDLAVAGATEVKLRNGDVRSAGAVWTWGESGVGKPFQVVAYRTEKALPLVTSAEVLDAEDNVIGYTSVTDFEPCFKDADAMTMDAPDTNPKRQYGITSIPLNLWSPLASAYGAVSLYNGSLKYGQGNYKATPVEASIYIAAALRHLLAWAEGEEFDPADGCPNLGGVLANIAILLDARAVGNLIDDRQIQGGYLKEREALKAIIKNLQAVHAGKTPRHYSLADSKVV